VWGVIVDLGTWPQWWPAIRDVELLGGEPGAPDAARFVFDTPSPLRPLVIGMAVTERGEPELLSVRAVDGPLVGHGVLEVSEEAGGSAARFDVRLRVRSLLLRPVETVLKGATRSAGVDRLRRAGDDLARLAGGEPREHRIGH
jgi:hypothetical protein